MNFSSFCVYVFFCVQLAWTVCTVEYLKIIYLDYKQYGSTLSETACDITPTQAFLNELQEQGASSGSVDKNIIGQFGVGFYSTFMVAEKVDVYTQPHTPGSQAWKWQSDGYAGRGSTPSYNYDLDKPCGRHWPQGIAAANLTPSHPQGDNWLICSCRKGQTGSPHFVLEIGNTRWARRYCWAFFSILERCIFHLEPLMPYWCVLSSSSHDVGIELYERNLISWISSPNSAHVYGVLSKRACHACSWILPSLYPICRGSVTWVLWRSSLGISCVGWNLLRLTMCSSFGALAVCTPTFNHSVG